LLAVKKLYEAGIAVVPCTPSATPPKWLADKYPEVLRVLSNGKKRSSAVEATFAKVKVLPVSKSLRRVVTA
jgi:hypothetical protein